MSRNRTATSRSGRPMLLLGALVYTAFVVYGSLVPLEFKALPWDESVARFRQIPFLKLGIGSRADWVANLLLFIPFAFLWMAVLGRQRSPATKFLVSMFVMAVAMALSVAIEFTQLYFPQRTVSLNDLIAETIGGVAGIMLWWFAGRRFLGWLDGWTETRSNLEFTQRLGVVYLAILFAYSLLPLDLTISPVEVFHKFREGKLNLIPFARLPEGAVFALYEVASDTLLWFVPALLWRWSGKASSLRVWTAMAGAALLLETLQLFVYSRVSDVTDIFTAAAGAGLGVWVAGLGGNQAMASTRLPDATRYLLPLLLSVVWTGVIFAVFWYPFNFRGDGAFLRDRLHQFLGQVPFEAYYFGTEYRAATEVMHKLLFFIPLGATFGWLVSHLRWMWRGYGTFLSLVLVLAVAAATVAGRLAQPEKSPDSIDALLHCMGGALGFVMARMLLGRKRLPTRPHRHAGSRAELAEGGEESA